MIKISAIILAIVAIVVLSCGFTFLNPCAFWHTLVFCFGLFIGFYYLIYSKCFKRNNYFIIALVTSVLTFCIAAYFFKNYSNALDCFENDSTYTMNPFVIFLTSYMYFVVLYFAFNKSLIPEKNNGKKADYFKFTSISIFGGSVVSSIGAGLKLLINSYSDPMYSNDFRYDYVGESAANYGNFFNSITEIIGTLVGSLIFFFPHNLLFCLCLFSLFVGFAKLYGFPKKIELDLQK